MILINFKTKEQSGFALLLTIIIIGVVLAITLTTINLSIKQTRLASDTRDSEIAFHAASAGVECIQHWRRSNVTAYESGSASVPITCFGETRNATVAQAVDPADLSGDGEVYHYEYEISWGTGASERCSEMRFLVFNADFVGDPLVLENVSSYVEGYPRDEDRKTCDSGGLCTIFAGRGYSTACPSSGVFPIGTVQRAIYLEF